LSPRNVATFAQKVDTAQVLFAVNSDLAASTLSASVATYPATYPADEPSPSVWLNRPNGRASPTKPSPKDPVLPPRLRHLAPPSSSSPLTTPPPINQQPSTVSYLASRISPLAALPTHPNRYNRPIQQTSPDPPGKGSPGHGRTLSCPAHTHHDANPRQPSAFPFPPFLLHWRRLVVSLLPLATGTIGRPDLSPCSS
jgi:hypothetical protein